MQQLSPVAGRYDGREREHEPVEERPAAAPASEPMPPMITTTSENSSHWPSCPCAIEPCEPPTTAPNATSAEPTKNAIANVDLDVDAERRRHLPVVDARADDHPRLRAVEPQPEREPDEDAQAEHREPRQRVVDPATCRSTRRYAQPGQEMLTALPPNLTAPPERDAGSGRSPGRR